MEAAPGFKLTACMAGPTPRRSGNEARTSSPMASGVAWTDAVHLLERVVIFASSVTGFRVVTWYKSLSTVTSVVTSELASVGGWTSAGTIRGNLVVRMDERGARKALRRVRSERFLYVRGGTTTISNVTIAELR